MNLGYISFYEPIKPVLSLFSIKIKLEIKVRIQNLLNFRDYTDVFSQNMLNNHFESFSDDSPIKNNHVYLDFSSSNKSTGLDNVLSN